MSIEIIEEGLYTTIQDKGRIGYQSYGFSVSGVMDEFAAVMANLLVGNHDQEALIEMSFIGPTIKFYNNAIIAITGADMSANVNDQLIPLGKPISIKEGDVLQFRTAKTGLYSYLAVKSGFDVTEVLGSRSTLVRAQLNGILGRKLMIGDTISLKDSFTVDRSMEWRLDPSLFNYISQSSHIIRYIRGPQFDWFDHYSFETTDWTTSTQSNRMGYRLKGTAVKRKNQNQLLTEATTFGSIQVPANGQPIVLMADGQPTGGYPKIGQVAKVDLGKLSQIRPGQLFRFQQVTVEEAIQLLHNRYQLYLQLRLFINEKWAGVSL
ncbi:biotin-dependent carboxyltransferase family protein [Gracilibacillus kekensis]|uniref:Antagonist of KipI n=1 Tax=Gracilibacillus kekensis TaxID=1027249 RepID=A0A1M7N1C3_9BACI|nr:biotin-dependent carboxyltransferase family protein [Gracilibacillus kekensis]SHM97348.1 antagonist of KipI [Gracilibacillus kekensis]